MNAIPHHIALILDGNARWAKTRKKNISYGHTAGVNKVEEIVEFCQEKAIEIITLYAFSSENWKRPPQEINVLLRLIRIFFKKKIKKIIDRQTRVIIIGDSSPFPEDIKKLIQEVQDLSKHCSKHVLQIALNYGGRDEIIRATKKCMLDYKNGNLILNDLSEESFKYYLDTTDYPDPELLIRTGGNQRISNFLLYQMAYTELYFTNTLWPDISKEEVDNIIFTFQTTERRFGGRNYLSSSHNYQSEDHAQPKASPRSKNGPAKIINHKKDHLHYFNYGDYHPHQVVNGKSSSASISTMEKKKQLKK